MKFLLIATLFLSVSAFAEGKKETTTSTPKTENVVDSIVKESKKTRKKKVEICGECGKAEDHCECDHSKEENKKK